MRTPCDFKNIPKVGAFLRSESAFKLFLFCFV